MDQQIITTEDGGYVVPPCPWWCERPTDHDLNNELVANYDGSVLRMHEASNWISSPRELELGAERVAVSVARCESVPEDEDEEPATVQVHASGSLTAAGARQLAAALLTASDKLDQITAAQR